MTFAAPSLGLATMTGSAFINRSLRRHKTDTALTYVGRVAPLATAGHPNWEDG
jgi:hypothetical protein